MSPELVCERPACRCPECHLAVGAAIARACRGLEAPPAAGALPRQGAAGPQQADHPALFQPCVLFQLRGLSPALLHGSGLKPPNPAPVQAQPGTRSPRHPAKVCAPQRQGRAQPSHGTRSVLLPALWLQLLPRHCSPCPQGCEHTPGSPCPQHPAQHELQACAHTGSSLKDKLQVELGAASPPRCAHSPVFNEHRSAEWLQVLR